MGALPRTHPTAAPKASPAPKPRLMLRPNGIHHGLTRAEVISKYERSKWAGRALDLHLFRVTGGGALGAWVKFIYNHTFGSPDKAERAGSHHDTAGNPIRAASAASLDYTRKPVHPEDAAKEFGFSSQAMREARNQAVEMGITPRQSARRADGNAYFSYAVDMENLAAAPNAWDAEREDNARQEAFVPRKPAGVQKAKSQALSTTCEESRASLIAREPADLAAGNVALLEEAEVEVTHALPCAVAIQSTVSDSGRVRIHLTESRKSNPAAPPPITPSTHHGAAGAGLNIIEVASANTPPNHPILPLSEDTLINGLAELGIATERRDIDLVRAQLRADVDYFLAAVVGDRVSRARPGEAITRRLLPRLVQQANEMWDRGGKQIWTARAEAPKPEVRCRRCNCILLRSPFGAGLCFDCHGGQVD